MEKKILNILKNALYIVAIVSASTPSQMGLYQPQIPKKIQQK